jgi:predicted DCC family thiol-disulfide oxidoreductase YuxK
VAGSFDRDCTICASLAWRFRPTLEKRGFGLAALQDPRVAALLALPSEQLLHEMHVMTGEGEIYSGAKAIVFLARQIWWASPLLAAAQLPGAMRILDTGYRWFADHWRCVSGICSRARENNETLL